MQDRGAGDGNLKSEPGYSGYTPLVLTVYDALVLGISNHLLWRCPTERLRALYDRNVSADHLDIGVGTGYFLDKARFPAPSPRITLLDMNTNCLARAARRIERYHPVAVRADILQPLPDMPAVSSVGLCYLLHCLPGDMAAKSVLFDHLRPVLAPDAVVFGATIVQGDAPRSWAAQRLMNAYNAKGIFCNAEDSFQGLRTELENRFADVRLERIGAVVTFEARTPQ